MRLTPRLPVPLHTSRAMRSCPSIRFIRKLDQRVRAAEVCFRPPPAAATGRQQESLQASGRIRLRRVWVVGGAGPVPAVASPLANGVPNKESGDPSSPLVSFRKEESGIVATLGPLGSLRFLRVSVPLVASPPGRSAQS